MAAQRVDPLGGFRFGLEIDQQTQGWFSECSGLNITRKTTPQPEGGVNDYVHQLPGRIEQSQITLKRGLAGNDLWNWFQEGIYDGKVKRRNVSIKLYSTDRTKVKRWNLTNAYPVKWSSSEFKADSNQLFVESIELVHHGLEVTDWVEGD